MYTFTGTLKVKKDEQVVSDKFKKREFVMSDDHESYPQVISFQLAQDKTSLIDAVEVGSQITVHFNLRGRDWTNKEGKVMYFNTLDAWRIESGAVAAPVAATAAFPVAMNLEEHDDLPF